MKKVALLTLVIATAFAMGGYGYRGGSIGAQGPQDGTGQRFMHKGQGGGNCLDPNLCKNYNYLNPPTQ